MFETIQSRAGGRGTHILEPIIELAVEIAREGREGGRIGTLFTTPKPSCNIRARSSSTHLPATPQLFATLRRQPARDAQGIGPTRRRVRHSFSRKLGSILGSRSWAPPQAESHLRLGSGKHPQRGQGFRRAASPK
jgi:hypothetical protein